MPDPSIRVTSRVDGLSEIEKVLKQLPDRVAQRTLQKAVNKGARVILKAAKEKAPRHTGKQSKASKMYGTIVRNLRLQSMSKIRKSARGVRIWTNKAFWAAFLEFGRAAGSKVRKRGKRKGQRSSWGAIQPMPFMRPAFDENAGKALEVMRQALAEGVEQEASKMAGEYKTARKSFGLR